MQSRTLLVVKILFMALLVGNTVSAQLNNSIIDIENSGVILYSQENYKGQTVRVSQFNKKEKIPFYIRSVKILGNYNLHTISDKIIDLDQSSLSLQPQEIYITSNKRQKIGIAYNKENYKGLATYLEAYQVINTNNILSLKVSPGYQISIKNKSGEMYYTCNNIAKIIPSPLHIQLRPRNCN